jgi:hypothetical protein
VHPELTSNRFSSEGFMQPQCQLRNSQKTRSQREGS